MQMSQTITNTGASLLAGYIATKVMDPVTSALYKWEPEASHRQEDEVRPGSPTKIAARKTAENFGIQLKGKKLGLAGQGFHYGLGVVWAPLYVFLRRASGMSPLGAGLATGASLSLIMDEIVNPAAGFSAKSREYPLATHLRGIVSHLVYGFAVAGAVEGILAIVGNRRSLDPAQ